MAHPTFTQPEALRLADALEGSFPEAVACSAADELRRLYAANIDCVDHFNALKAERDELLEALKEVLAAERFSNRPPETVMQAEEKLARIRAAAAKADAAIAKATGGQA